MCWQRIPTATAAAARPAACQQRDALVRLVDSLPNPRISEIDIAGPLLDRYRIFNFACQRKRPLVVSDCREMVAVVKVYVANVGQNHLVIVDDSGFVVYALRLAKILPSPSRRPGW